MHAERELDKADVIALLKLSGIHKRARGLVERYLSPQHAEDLDQLAKYP
jgi:precorrin-2 methylase